MPPPLVPVVDVEADDPFDVELDLRFFELDEDAEDEPVAVLDCAAT